MTQHARDEAGNIWEVDAAGNAVRLVQPAGHLAPAITIAPNPAKVAEQQRTDARQNASDQRAAEANARAANAESRAQAKFEREDTVVPTPGDMAKTGDDYLATLDPGLAGQVRALSEGRRAFPTGTALKDPSIRELIAAATQYDPTLDAANAATRVSTRRDFTSGPTARNISSLNTALGHLGSLWNAAQELDNSKFPWWNRIANPAASAAGNTRVQGALKDFDVARNAAATELMRAFRGGTGTGSVQEINDWQETINSADSPTALRHAIGQGIELLQSRLQALGDQYQRGMGQSKDPISLLSPHAQQVYQHLQPGGDGTIPGATFGGGGGGPRSGGGGPNDRPDASTTYYQNGNGESGGGNLALSQDGTQAQADPVGKAVVQRLNAMLKGGAPDADIANYASQIGTIDMGTVTDVLRFRAANPKYNGDYNFTGFDQKNEPMGLLHQGFNAAAQSPVGTAAIGSYSGVNDLSFGLANKATGNPDMMEMGIDAVRSKHPVAFFGGEMIPMTAAAAGFEAGLPAAAAASGLRDTSLVARALSSPVTADLVAGGYQGAGASPGHRIAGALLGAGTSGVGGVIGRNVIGPGGALLARTRPGMALSRAGNAVTNGVRRAFKVDEVPLPTAPAAPSKVEQILLNSIHKAGPEKINNALGTASELNVPMGLADTDPVLRELAGQAVRRSPTASDYAESVLYPRARGQIERLTQSVERNLGPIGNIPQLSEDLTNRARTAAAPLYEQAYAAPGASSQKIDELLQTPFGQQALSRARTIAANGRRDPTTLGFDLDQQGNVTLNRVPSMQTLDYVKRGMDDVLEQYRNPVTNRLQLDEAGRAQSAVKNDLLSEMDRINPAYAQARAAYAGPAQSRDALFTGQDAYSLPPNTVGQMAAGRSPEQLEQMQLGFRDAMMNQANRVRYNSNPYDATLGNPQAETRLRTIFPDNNGVDALVQQRDLEGRMAGTTNAVLGNSKTAQRVIADQQFATNPLVEGALNTGAAIATHGASIPGTAARLVGSGIKNKMVFGMGKQAEAKAEALIPYLLNTDPTASSAIVDDLVNKSSLYDAYIEAQRAAIARKAGAIGAAGGANIAELLSQ